ncbi:LPS export ABC transporter periplasmic protein LptC [Pricia sp. S334]|uniref:LPS export ABC transporter periplasmic protein LptC n=1 Tax=Pricia mediterranea TaxID=3076079 RepID=A0ABU3L6Q2_9FLAO|nr:LPS export ABC transporter periplasmic protein LptC [Pricia sp. S334]MDT7829248.1 LPS export ABC transporter periplasmic protein LptC [Pricia sp. S334]
MTVVMAILFLSCDDTYKRSGEEKVPMIYPVGIAEDFTFTYTEAKTGLESEDSTSTKVVAVLTSPLRKDYTNLNFGYQTFPDGLVVDFFDDEGRKNIIKADFGIIYSATNVIDLQGNVVIETHDGKIMETDQVYWDQDHDWVFTQEAFKYTNPEDGSVMFGTGMDFKQEPYFFSAHKTNGLMSIKEESQ